MLVALTLCKCSPQSTIRFLSDLKYTIACLSGGLYNINTDIFLIDTFGCEFEPLQVFSCQSQMTRLFLICVLRHPVPWRCFLSQSQPSLYCFWSLSEYRLILWEVFVSPTWRPYIYPNTKWKSGKLVLMVCLRESLVTSENSYLCRFNVLLLFMHYGNFQTMALAPSIFNAQFFFIKISY